MSLLSHVSNERHVGQEKAGVGNLSNVPDGGRAMKTVRCVIDAPGGNYTDLLIKATLAARPGRVTYFEVQHDAWCALLGGRGPCNCDPEVVEVPPP